MGVYKTNTRLRGPSRLQPSPGRSFELTRVDEGLLISELFELLEGFIVYQICPAERAHVLLTVRVSLDGLWEGTAFDGADSGVCS